MVSTTPLSQIFSLVNDKIRPTVIVGLFFQQVIAMFVLKTSAGYDIFSWIARLAADFLEQAYAGAAFFFSREVVGYHWFFVNVLSSIIFFIAFVQMLYYVSIIFTSGLLQRLTFVPNS